MKLLKVFDDPAQAWDQALILRGKGILVHISSGQVPFLMQSTLWAVLEHQYEDAALLMYNPDHEVHSGLSADILSTLEHQAEELAVPLWNRVLFSPWLILSVLILAFIYVADAGDLYNGPEPDGTSHIHHFWEPHCPGQLSPVCAEPVQVDGSYGELSMGHDGTGEQASDGTAPGDRYR